MFGRSKTPEGTPTESTSTPDIPTVGKGRPTPTRREREAENKARNKPPRTRKEQLAAQRAARSAGSPSRDQMREGMRTGDERYLPARDKGPVRRFVRDFVDSRWTFLEIMMPVVLVSLLLGLTRNPTLMGIGSMMSPVALLIALVDGFLLHWRLRRQLKLRFPDQSTKGATFYALSRAISMRFMRLPKPQVRIGEQLPERYR